MAVYCIPLADNDFLLRAHHQRVDILLPATLESVAGMLNPPVAKNNATSPGRVA